MNIILLIILLLTTFGIVLDAHANTLNEEMKRQVKSPATDVTMNAAGQILESLEDHACNNTSSRSCHQAQLSVSLFTIIGLVAFIVGSLLFVIKIVLPVLEYWLNV